MLKQITSLIKDQRPAEDVHAHCDAPCGVYDPASARIAAEASLSMTKKILALTPPEHNDARAMATYLNSMARYIQVKEEQTQIAKDEILILWTDYFKPEHLDQFSDLHTIIWQATKLCSSVKQEVSLEHAEELLATVQRIHDIFWTTKKRDIEWYTAS